MRALRAAGRVAAYAATALLAGGLAVRFTTRDSVAGLSAIYYATPWAVLSTCALLPALLWVRRRRFFTAGGFALVFALCTAAWVKTAFRSAPDSRAKDFRVAYWNTGRPGGRVARSLAHIHAIDADIFGLGETKRSRNPATSEWADGLRGKNVLTLRRNMLLVSREAASQVHDGFLNDRGQYALTETQIRGRQVFVLLVDFDAIIAYSRKPAFDRLFQLIDAIGDAPLIVMGDFNTPSDSVHFTELRKRMKSAFESAGSGYAKTWPMPLPVLDIDHIWVSRHFEIAACTHRTTFLSDHRAVFADLRWADGQGLN
ncbi:MAG: hypothetical protein RL088_1795 [Verrucomicrobiota bacterium]|jgi:endonuclease/exonuclease/phosphatase (EEP) superfamily protein YafD